MKNLNFKYRETGICSQGSKAFEPGNINLKSLKFIADTVKVYF